MVENVGGYTDDGSLGEKKVSVPAAIVVTHHHDFQ